MDATQAISDSILESEEEENEENENRRGSPLAKLCILKNSHIPETELPLFLGDNVLGRDPSLCTLPIAASSVSKEHATICISVYRRRGVLCDVDMEALVWDLGSMNGTRKGRLKLTPNVRYALSDGDNLVFADIPCQYVRCGGVSSQDDTRTPGCGLSGVKGMFPDAPGEKQGDTDRGSKRCVNGGAKAKKTPVRGTFLSFEQTPAQPQGCLVPDSDSDSDSERGGGGNGHQKTQVSDSDSHKSGPNSSAFLSPPNKIVPESEDESPITPSSSSRPTRHVSFNTEKSEVCVERNKSPAFVENSETEGKGGRTSKESGQNENGNSNVTFTGEDGSLVSTPEVSREAIPEFNMDSDTDVEGEEEVVVPVGPLSFNSSPSKPSKSSSDETTKPAHVASGIQPEAIFIDSDTDVDDDDVSDAVTKASSSLDANTAGSASSVQLKVFHLDSDTDVDEEESENKTCSKTNETPIKSDFKPVVPASNPAAAAGDPSVAAGADLDILSDSDTDMEEDCLLVKPLVATDPSVVSGKTSGALESDSDEDTDVDEPCVPLAGDNPAELRVDSEEAGEDQIPRLPLVPTLQHCSTPVLVSEREVEDLETQAFTSPPSTLFRCPALKPAVLLSSDSPEDEDYAVAETQSFVLQTRDQQTGTDPNPASAPEPKDDERSGVRDSPQLGLSDSSHLQSHGAALMMENTQAYVSADGGVSLEETQAYETTSNLDATQVYEEEEEPVRDSEESETKVCVNLAFEATQAYISEPHDDSDEDKRRDVAPTETTDLLDYSSTLATAETQLVPSFEDESLEIKNQVCSVQHVETKERDPAQPQEKHLFEAETQPMCMMDTEESNDEDSSTPPQPQTCSSSSLAETQPMHVDETQPVVLCDNDDSMPLLRKRKAKWLSIEEEESQRLGSSGVYVAETQPIFVSEDDDEDDSGPCRREAKPLQLEDEQISSDVATQPGDPAEENNSEVLVVPRKRKAKQLHIEDETQQLVSSAEAQPTCEEEDVEAGPQRGEIKPQQHDEEQINPPTSTEVADVDKSNHKDAVTAKQHDQPGVSNSRQTRARLGGKQDDAGCSAPTKRQTRQGSKTLPSTRGSRGKATAQGEEEVKQPQQTRGRKSTRRQEVEEDDKIIAAKGLIKGRKEGRLEQDVNESESMDIGVATEKQEEVERRNQGELKNKQKASEEQEQLQEEELEESEGIKEEQKLKVPPGSKDEEEKPNVSARARRSTRKTAPCTAPPEQNITVSTREDFPARRTRSRSNSSNSVSSERSASSVGTQESRGRGRGRGAKRSSETLQTPVIRSSRRRTAVAAAPTEKDGEDITSEISTCSESSQNRARGGRQRGKGRKTHSEWQNSTERVGKTGMAEELSSEVLPMDAKDKGDARQTGTSRGQQRVSATAESSQDKEEKSPLPKRKTRGRGHVEEPVAPSVSEEGRNQRKGKKSEVEVNIKADAASVFKGKALKTTEEEEGKDEQTEESSSTVQARRTSRASSAQVKKKAKEALPGEQVEDGENMEVQAVERKTRGRTSNQKEELKESETSASSTKQEAPETPDRRGSRKRQASSDSSPLAKTPRSSSGSPAAIGRLRAGSQSYKVLFTGVVDEAGERVLARLGGGMAKGVADMNCLVTDKVRRTVKFLCAVAKGIPVVTTDWLQKSGKAGSFLPTNAFVVKDPEQEKKFSFCLQESLKTARSQPLLQGYEIHVTKSVKPEPVHMKDIISCSGATFLSKMPSSHKPQTVVISCEEDWRLCGPAVSASLPVVTTEFVLTGILQQKLDFHTHALSPTSTANSQPAGDRGRTRRKT